MAIFLSDQLPKGGEEEIYPTLNISCTLIHWPDGLSTVLSLILERQMLTQVSFVKILHSTPSSRSCCGTTLLKSWT